VDDLLAADAAQAAARRAATYQEWRADVFEQIQAQVDAHMSKVDASALEARLLARYNAFLAADAPTERNARGGTFREVTAVAPCSLVSREGLDDAAAAASAAPPRFDARRVRDPVKADLRRREEERAALRAAAAVIHGATGAPSHGFEFGGAHEAPRGTLDALSYGDVKGTTRHGRWTDRRGNEVSPPARGGGAGGHDAFASAVSLRHDPSRTGREVVDAEMPPRTRAPVPGSVVAAAMRGGASAEMFDVAAGRRPAPSGADGAARMAGVMAHAHRGSTPPRGSRDGRPRGPGRVPAPERAPPAGQPRADAQPHGLRHVTLPPAPPEHYGRRNVPPPASGARNAPRGMYGVLADPVGGELDRPSWTQPPVQAPSSTAASSRGSGGSSVAGGPE
jgi:hypothetical protein